MKKTVILFSLNIFLILSIIFIIYFLSGSFFNSNDFYFHFFKASFDCFTDQYSLSICNNYAPLLHFLAFPFSFSEFSFILFNVFILFFLIPFLIFEKVKDIFSLLIYFSVAFPFLVLYNSTFAFGLLGLFIVLILRNKFFNRFDLFYFVLAYFSHSKAIFILPILFIFKFFNTFKHIFNFKLNVSYFNYSPFLVLSEKVLSFSDFLRNSHLLLIYYYLHLSIDKIFLFLFFVFGAIFLRDFRPILYTGLLFSLWIPNLFLKFSKTKRLFIAINLGLYSILQYLLFFIDTFNLNLH